MEKMMVRIDANGTVINAESWPYSTPETEVLKIPGDRAVGIGDIYDNGKWFRDGVEILTPLEAEVKELKAVVDLVNGCGGIRQGEREQSDKLGCDWVKTWVGDTLVKTEYVAQENPRGTADNPIPWTEDTVLIVNAFYLYDGVRKVWTGSTGAAASWDDEKWEEF